MFIYRLISTLFFPFIFLFLVIRLLKKKEDKNRFKERFGFASVQKPQDSQIIWIHAVSVGEVNSSFGLAEELLKFSVKNTILITTTTLTSAAIVQQRLPQFKGRVIHQFLPIDITFCVKKFLKFWQPRAAIFMESEIWPNFIMQARKRGVLSFLINARMSEKSYKKWLIARKFGLNIFDFFAVIFLQKKEDELYFSKLSRSPVLFYGNLKSQAQIPAVDEEEVKNIKKQIGRRKFWLATNTHAGEEEIILKIHQKLKETYPNLLTILVPRHPNRADEIKQLMSDVNFAQRSYNQPITKNTELYLADTLGEIGNFYALASFTFLGGSFVDVGGHNPYEPVKLGCLVISGDKVFNAKEAFDLLERENCCVMVNSKEQLEEKVMKFIDDKKSCKAMSDRALKIVENSSENIAAKIVQKIDQMLLFNG